MAPHTLDEKGDVHIWRFDYLLPGHSRCLNVLEEYSKFWDRFGVKWYILTWSILYYGNLEIPNLYVSVQTFSFEIFRKRVQFYRVLQHTCSQYISPLAVNRLLKRNSIYESEPSNQHSQ